MIGHLQELQEKYKDKGFVLLGLNCSDSKGVAAAFLKENGATFPTVLDNSPAASRVLYGGYENTGRNGGQSAVPLNYIIDREGKVAVAWYGGECTEGEKAMEKLGIK